MVVCTQYQHDVFDRNDDREGPEKERQNTKDIGRGQRHMPFCKNRFNGVQNAGTNIAVNDTDSAQSERRK